MADDFALPADPASAWAAAPATPLVSEQMRALVTQIFEPTATATHPRSEDRHSGLAQQAQIDAPPPASALCSAAHAAFAAALGPEHVRTDASTRAAHANGMSYLDLLRHRLPAARALPDAVLEPADEGQIAALLAVAAEHAVAVVPFGGGTSVVGGVTPAKGELRAVVALDLARLDRLVELDEVSRTATLQAGLTGPAADALLAAHGFTLGHVPQSFERATIGGYAATRSAGQLSTGWGRFDALVERLRAVTPAGTLVLGRAPGTAAGPDLKQLLLGSEGAFGVITEVTVRVRPLPQARRHEGWRVESFAAGAALLRRLAQDGPRPDLARLSDETETAMGFATGGEQGGEGCLLLVGWEGGEADVNGRALATAALLQAAGAHPLGEPAAASWRSGRFRAPRMRDELIDLGVAVETLETAASWRDLERVHAAVGEALRDALGEQMRPVVACHVSHLYAAGASLYFSVIARRDPADPVGQWQRAKHAATDAMAAAGATITHHHAVGADHAPWLAAEVGEEGVALLRAVKAQLDPAGIMNPGKLLA
ncbi:FAD-binding oxidoreductase [Conexibacter stalactiti]|uniref:FAD-binding oxidoreductase n=1 Tax=Conexibacter stalactiti TaxID=1940611 RepID=A0ABU4HN70_9ACTN|nr:FAD-binding oxidoreductase [Conexibacter stalactiti]MDW5594753.1 FAD-binding oxidoreductase [Conexibacter stalactiti]MEC5035395.1 FAD-binding oxidoreductase [Conexibacter stalactiti]